MTDADYVQALAEHMNQTYGEFVDGGYEPPILRCIIHYPTLTIHNEDGLSHFMRDLYVKLTIRIYEGRMSLQTIEGCRASLSYKEWNKRYAHSHLPEHTMCRFMAFCRGRAFDHYRNLQLTEESYQAAFTGFTVLLNQYCRTESIRGRPYKFISELANTSACPSTFGRIIVQRNIHTERVAQHMEFTMDEHGLHLRESDDLWLALGERLPEDYKCSRKTDGSYFRFRQTQAVSASRRQQAERELRAGGRHTFLFRENIVYPRLYEDESQLQIQDMPQVWPLPAIQEYAKTYINEQINNHFITERARRDRTAWPAYRDHIAQGAVQNSTFLS